MNTFNYLTMDEYAEIYHKAYRGENSSRGDMSRGRIFEKMIDEKIQEKKRLRKLA